MSPGPSLMSISSRGKRGRSQRRPGEGRAALYRVARTGRDAGAEAGRARGQTASPPPVHGGSALAALARAAGPLRRHAPGRKATRFVQHVEDLRACAVGKPGRGGTGLPERRPRCRILPQASSAHADLRRQAPLACGVVLEAGEPGKAPSRCCRGSGAPVAAKLAHLRRAEPGRVIDSEGEQCWRGRDHQPQGMLSAPAAATYAQKST